MYLFYSVWAIILIWWFSEIFPKIFCDFFHSVWWHHLNSKMSRKYVMSMMTKNLITITVPLKVVVGLWQFPALQHSTISSSFVEAVRHTLLVVTVPKHGKQLISSVACLKLNNPALLMVNLPKPMKACMSLMVTSARTSFLWTPSSGLQ